jgi:malate synthase
VSVRGLELRAPVEGRAREVLTEEALEFVAGLHAASTRAAAALSRARRAAGAHRGGELPDFLPDDPESARATGGSRRPGDLQDRRCEITGPVERKMMINALNSGARCFMADFEDANSPTWANCVDGQSNLATRSSGRSSSRRRTRRTA